MDQQRLRGRDPGRSSSTESHSVQRRSAPGKHTLTEAMAPVQTRSSSAAAGLSPRTDHADATSTAPGARPTSRRAEALFGLPAVQQAQGGAAPAPRGEDASQAHAAAARGTATPASQLPHADRIQRLFGRHDISGIQAHMGGEAAASARGMGARAYATGDHVVFDDAPDLHTAAHEAAHVIQQRGGVQLKGGVGEEGDRYERHADAVADRVVRGESATALLDELAPGGAGGGAAIQRIVGQGLLPGTPIIWNGSRGIVLQEVQGVGYRVRVMTSTQPSVAYQLPQPVPYNELDPGNGLNNVPFVTSMTAPQQQGQQPVHDGGMDDEHSNSNDEVEDEFGGTLDELPGNITLNGITYTWQSTGGNSLLKPSDGRDYPHIWFAGQGDLTKLHFTSASFKGDTNQVSVIRRGYRWNGMHSRLQADPEFAENEQLLGVKTNNGAQVTFDLTGGRPGMRVGIAAPHVGRPSVAQLATALNIPHE